MKTRSFMGLIGASILTIFTAGCTTPSQKDVTPTDTQTPIARPHFFKEYTPGALSEIRGKSKAIVFFHAGWCGVCSEWEKQVQQESLPEGAIILKADFDQETKLRQTLRVAQQSTAVFINADGTIAQKLIDPPMEQVQEFFQ